MNEPQQGCFVKNEEYTGQKDEYDFYFVDKQNHCVRTLTPTPSVIPLSSYFPHTK